MTNDSSSRPFGSEEQLLPAWRQRAAGEAGELGTLVTRSVLADRLARNEQARVAQQLGVEQKTYREIAAQLGVSPTKARSLGTTRPYGLETDALLRAMLGKLGRDELVRQLGAIRYRFHGYGELAAPDGSPVGNWDFVIFALIDGVLSPTEYQAIADLVAQPARQALARPVCDGFVCTEHDEHIYITCYGEPVFVGDRDHCHNDWLYAPYDAARGVPRYQTTHYVGWTRTQPPIKRVRSHGAKSAHFVARIIPGNTYEEDTIRAFSPCPTCGASLDYFRENPGLPEWRKFWHLLGD
jgi:hypothetical protein